MCRCSIAGRWSRLRKRFKHYWNTLNLLLTMETIVLKLKVGVVCFLTWITFDQLGLRKWYEPVCTKGRVYKRLTISKMPTQCKKAFNIVYVYLKLILFMLIVVRKAILHFYGNTIPLKRFTEISIMKLIRYPTLW